MSDTEVDVSELIDIEMGNETLHVSCCVADKFFCGRNWHPEMIAQHGVDRDECCVTCVKMSDESWCPPHRPTHSHCPVPGLTLGMVCPSTSGR